jgi:tetratricopeptide (TPR) repeat protein
VALAAAGLSRVSLVRPGGGLAAVALTTLGLAALLGLIRLTRAQCQVWRTTESLWTHVLKHGGERCAIAHNNLGVALNAQGHSDEARARFEETLRLRPDHPEAHCNLGLYFMRQGRLEEARAHYEEGLRLMPSLADAHKDLGIILKAQGHSDEARAEFEKALQLSPSTVAAHDELGVLLLQQGRKSEAGIHFNEALRFSANDLDAHFNLGVLHLQQGRLGEAKEHFDAALRINPNFARAYNNRAMIRATAADAKYRDGPGAVEDATHACALTDWKNAAFLDTLAAAHAEAADFDAAVKWQTRAIDLLTDEARKEDLRSRLKLYQARQPYRESVGAH